MKKKINKSKSSENTKKKKAWNGFPNLFEISNAFSFYKSNRCSILTINNLDSRYTISNMAEKWILAAEMFTA